MLRLVTRYPTQYFARPAYYVTAVDYSKGQARVVYALYAYTNKPAARAKAHASYL